jgi:hypothetical protein
MVLIIIMTIIAIIIIQFIFRVLTNNIGLLQANIKIRSTHKIRKKYNETETISK